MDLNLSVFQEPRGVMRVIQFVFSICAFATITGYSGEFVFHADEPYSCPIEYSFNIYCKTPDLKCENNCNNSATILGDFSSDAQFFVATGVLAMLYCIGIVVLYTKFDELYKTNTTVPLIDFGLSVVLAILWLSSSAAWANGLSGLKAITDGDNIAYYSTNCTCRMTSPNFSALTISVILGFLNFFLWGADLWFLYKETTWFQGAQPTHSDGN